MFWHIELDDDDDYDYKIPLIEIYHVWSSLDWIFGSRTLGMSEVCLLNIATTSCMTQSTMRLGSEPMRPRPSLASEPKQRRPETRHDADQRDRQRL